MQIIIYLLQDGSCNGLQHYAALGRDQVTRSMIDLKIYLFFNCH